jgi:hypothetical protein
MTRTLRLLSLLIPLSLAACGDGTVPHADPAIDRMAREYLGKIESRDIEALRAPLSDRGKREVTSRAMEPIFDYFASGSPSSTTLLDAEVASSTDPSPATRHRLIYSIRFPDEREYHFFFEVTIGGSDTSISGFRIEPYE